MTSIGTRIAAGFVCAVFTVFVLFHLLWAVGITWGLEEVFDGPSEGSIGLTVASLIGGTAGAAVIYVTASRVGWHRTRLPDRLVELGSWVVFSWPAIGTLNPSTPWEQRTVTVPLAIAALVVARSRRQPATRPPAPLRASRTRAHVRHRQGRAHRAGTPHARS